MSLGLLPRFQIGFDAETIRKVADDDFECFCEVVLKFRAVLVEQQHAVEHSIAWWYPELYTTCKLNDVQNDSIGFWPLGCDFHDQLGQSPL